MVSGYRAKTQKSHIWHWESHKSNPSDTHDTVPAEMIEDLSTIHTMIHLTTKVSLKSKHT